MDRNLLLQNAFVAVVVILVIMCAWVGFRSGKAMAQAKLTLMNANQLATAFNYFYSDYGRFPSQLEYQTPQLMATYLSKWPALEFRGKLCPQSFGYESQRYNEYVLFVCLPKATDSLLSGWNEFTVRK